MGYEPPRSIGRGYCAGKSLPQENPAGYLSLMIGFSISLQKIQQVLFSQNVFYHMQYIQVIPCFQPYVLRTSSMYGLAAVIGHCYLTEQKSYMKICILLFFLIC